jgi:hypothetical protein
MSALPPKANVKRPATLKGPFHALAKITSFLAKYRKTLLATRSRKRSDENAT